MSILRCDNCDRFIDTDFDPAAITLDIIGREIWLCDTCREKRDREEYEWAAKNESL